MIGKYTARSSDFGSGCFKISYVCVKFSRFDGIGLRRNGAYDPDIIWYQTRKLPDETRRDWIKQICELLTVAGAENEAILKAVNNTEFKDFEDALQDCCATSFRADYTITVNIKDFKGVSSVKALTSRDFLNVLEWKACQ